MEYVVQETVEKVLQDTVISNNVVMHSDSTVSVESENNLLVVYENESRVLVESNTHEVILTGSLGPRGLSAEDVDVYSKRIDFVSDYEIYKGEANVGSAESSPVWRIRKILISAVDSDVTELWAEGNASFDKVWNNRTSLVYS